METGPTRLRSRSGHALNPMEHELVVEMAATEAEDGHLLSESDASSTDSTRSSTQLSHRVASAKRPPMTIGEMASLSCYWLGWATLWMPLMVVIIPKQIVMIAGPENKGSNLTNIFMMGSVVSLLCLPLFGSMSDICTHRWGRRRPFMVAGCCFASISIFVMSLNPALPTYTLAFLILSIANNAIMAPYSGLVPDVVPASQHGVVSSWLGGMSMLGYLLGGVISFFVEDIGLPFTMLLLNAVHAASMYLTVKGVFEEPLTTPQPAFSVFTCCYSLIRPMMNHDFFLLFITRFFMQMGIATVQEFMSFYVKDALYRPYTFRGKVLSTDPEAAVSLLLIPLILGAVFSSSLSGVLSDFIGGRRKVIVYWSGGLMASACLLLSISRSFGVVMFLATVFGLGYGAFASVDWAMVTDILPNADEFAKDMGVWSLAMVLPNIFMPCTGSLLDRMQAWSPAYNLGYFFLFLTAVIEIAIGTYLVRLIRKIR